MKTPVLAALLLLATAPGLQAQFNSSYDFILLPVTPGTQAGAYGSQWVTTVTLTNRSDQGITVGGIKGDCGAIQCVDPPSLQPRATVVTTDVFRCHAAGMTLWTEKGRLSDLGVTLRTRDMSRQNETWGTTIPVVTPASLYDRPFQILDIPTDPQFRALLRLYNIDQAGSGGARVRIYAVDSTPNGKEPDALVEETTIAFSRDSTSGCPSYAELQLGQAAGGQPSSRLRVDVEPLDGRKNYWGFVSVTHDSTQFVTVVTPSP